MRVRAGANDALRDGPLGRSPRAGRTGAVSSRQMLDGAAGRSNAPSSIEFLKERGVDYAPGDAKTRLRTQPPSAGWFGKRASTSRNEAGYRHRPTHRPVQNQTPFGSVSSMKSGSGPTCWRKSRNLGRLRIIMPALVCGAVRPSRHSPALLPLWPSICDDLLDGQRRRPTAAFRTFAR